MAFIWPEGTNRRLDGSNKTFRLVLTPHGFVATKWPKKRGLPKDSYQKSIQDRMRELTMAQRQMLPQEWEPLQKALDQWKKENVGHMGAASIRLRDLITQIQAGRAFALQMPGGRVVYHVDAMKDITRILDWIRPRMGGLLVRTSNGWATTNNCLATRTFKLTDPDSTTDVCPKAD